MDPREAGRSTLMIVDEDWDNARLLAIAAQSGGWRTITPKYRLEDALEQLGLGGVNRLITAMVFYNDACGGVRIVEEALARGMAPQDIMVFSGTDLANVPAAAPLVEEGVAYAVKPRDLAQASRFVSLGKLALG